MSAHFNSLELNLIHFLAVSQTESEACETDCRFSLCPVDNVTVVQCFISINPVITATVTVTYPD